VSFYNETLGKSIYPTPVIGVLGILEDASRVVKTAFRDAGDVIVLLDGRSSSSRHSELVGEGGRSQQSLPSPPAKEFSSSEYSKTVGGIVAGEPPAIDLAAEKKLIDCLVALASDGIVASAHDISDGGLAVTLAESCFASIGARERASGLGATVKAADAPGAEFAFFGERGARCVISVAPAKLAALQGIARQYGVAASEIGQVTREPSLRIEYKGSAIIDSPLQALREVWTNSLEHTLQSSEKRAK
jgi:phosphoribosylformylglycinamidine synthase